MISVPQSSILAFQQGLLMWDTRFNTRKNVWKDERDPYRVWVREIMLQQTRQEQAKDYYDRFMDLFPDVGALANAPEEVVFKAWEGLGYYSRCRNLIHTARTIVRDYGGIFPTTYEQIIQLKGIGAYTASAVVSFCFGQDYAVYDGNVERVLARFVGFDKDVSNEKNKTALRTLATQFLIRGKSATYNQAIMDFGAVVCKPKQALCTECPLQPHCSAYQHNTQSSLPYKRPKDLSKTIYLLFLVPICGDSLALHLPSENPLWKHLRLFPSVPMHSLEALYDQTILSEKLNTLCSLSATDIQTALSQRLSSVFQQVLTHRNVFARFLVLELDTPTQLTMQGVTWIDRHQLHTHTFPVLVRNYLASEGKSVRD